MKLIPFFLHILYLPSKNFMWVVVHNAFLWNFHNATLLKLRSLPTYIFRYLNQHTYFYLYHSVGTGSSQRERNEGRALED